MWNLYSVPLPTPGRKPSQIRDSSRGHSACASSAQSLNEPITDTCSAFGAHTEKHVPATPLRITGCAPNFLERWKCDPSLNRYKSSLLSTVSSDATVAAPSFLFMLVPRWLSRVACRRFQDFTQTADRDPHPVRPVVEFVADLVHDFFQKVRIQ